MGTDTMTASENVQIAVAGVQSAAPDALRVPSVLRCAFRIFLVKMSLRIRGFGRTLRGIRQRVEAVPEVASADIEAIKATEYAVALAAAFYPARAKCLEQSLVLYYFLRRQGVAVRYCQGVQPYPFKAHAWIEYRGEVVNDVPEHPKQFSRLPDQLP